MEPKPKNFSIYLTEVEKIQKNSKNDEEMIGNILEYIRALYLTDDDFIFQNYMDIVDAIYQHLKKNNLYADKIWQVGMIITNAFFLNSSDLITKAVDNEIEIFKYMGQEKHFASKHSPAKRRNVISLIKSKKEKEES